MFNASWTIDGAKKDKSLFDMIRNTHQKTPEFTVSAYSDNAAVLQGERANFWAPDYSTGSWTLTPESVHILAKVEVGRLTITCELIKATNLFMFTDSQPSHCHLVSLIARSLSTPRNLNFLA